MDNLSILYSAGADLVNWGPQANIGMFSIHLNTFT